MFGALRLAGVVAGVLVAALVYVDASRRDVDRAPALALVVGAIAAAGFVAPSALYEAAYRGDPSLGVAAVPGRLFAGMALTGVVVAAAAVLVYGLAARLGDGSIPRQRAR